MEVYTLSRDRLIRRIFSATNNEAENYKRISRYSRLPLKRVKVNNLQDKEVCYFDGNNYYFVLHPINLRKLTNLLKGGRRRERNAEAD